MKNEMGKTRPLSQDPHNKSLFLQSHQSQTKQVQNQRQNHQVPKVVLWEVQMVVSHKSCINPPSGNGGAGNPNAVTATVGDKKQTLHLQQHQHHSHKHKVPPLIYHQAFWSRSKQTPSGPSSSADGISAADVNFGQDIVNGTSQTPTPSTPNSGSEVDTPSNNPNTFYSFL